MTSSQVLRDAGRAAPGAAILERALRPEPDGLSDAASELIALAEGRRAPLEAAQSLLIARLHRRSDDFDATRALCSVSAALSRIGWEMPTVPTRRRWTGRRT